MARAQGARSQLALAYETVYGAPPMSRFQLMPFARATLGSEQPLLESELLGYERDPLALIKDAVTADGKVVIPIDAEAFGHWLKAAFGQLVTTGTTHKTHTFQSGNWTLPSMSIKTAMHRGAALWDVFGLRSRPSVLADATLRPFDRSGCWHAHGAELAAPKPLQRHGQAQRLGLGQCGVCGSHLIPTTSTGSKPSVATTGSTARTRPWQRSLAGSRSGARTARW
ncbi:MAG: phage tail tube protein [Paracoccaceae bacterium]